MVSLRPLHALAIAGAVAGCVAVGDDRVVVYDPHPAQAVHIPPGHMPPPGACRIWYPDRPPGHQPPPGPCRELARRVPHGAVLVRG